jgi:two-component system cell cycle sensor histidine kinase/response regulator CckA
MNRAGGGWHGWLERAWVRYAFAVALALGATYLKLHFAVVGRDAPVAVFLGAILLAAWVGGTGPGLAATAVACASMAYFFLAPFDSFAVGGPDDVLRLTVAAGEGVLVSLLVGALRRSNLALDRQLRETAKAQTALKLTKEQLHRAQKVLSLGEFATGVAHDVNNMIMIVLTTGEMLERRLDGNDERSLDDARQIRDAAEQIAGLMRELLAFARDGTIAHATIDLHDVVDRLAPMLRRIAGSSVRLELALGASDARVQGDGSRIAQVIVNLALNARDAMRDNGGSITIGTAAAQPGRLVELFVSDTGNGMDDATVARVFEPFFTTKPRGTGLGLSVVRGVVEAMGGSVHVESAPTRGTTFRVRLPLA